MECPSCGIRQDSSNAFCEGCGARLPSSSAALEDMAIFEQQLPSSDAATRGFSAGSFPRPSEPEPARPAPRQVVSHRSPNGSTATAIPVQQTPMFRLAHGEQVLKSYDVVHLRTGLFQRLRGHGTLYVTDARVIFYAQVYPRGTQKASWLFQQTKLEEVSGVSAIVSRRVSLGLAVLILISALATVFSLLLLPLAFLFAILTIVLIIVAVRDARRRGDVGVSINSRENGFSPINFGHLPRERGFLDALGRLIIFPIAIFLHSYSARDVLSGDPADQANELLHELGALIIDLQTRGTMAYPEWGIAVPAGAVGAAVAQ